MSDGEEPDVTIRPAAPADEAFIRELSREVFSHFGDYATILIDYFRDDSVRASIAERRGTPIGFAMLLVELDRPTIVDLVAIAVAPASQGTGVGRALIDHVHEVARTESRPGITSIVHLTVAEDNHRARRFFRAAGYVPAPGPSGRYPAGQRSISMVRILDD